MGNNQTKGQNKNKQKKQVHWKAAERPQPPGKPQLVPGVDLTPDVVTIKWDKPKNDGGSPITGYLVEHRRTGSPHWVRATPLLVLIPELTLSGLEPGWRYQFRVSAQNAVGMSQPGEISEPLTVTLQRSVITASKFTEELVNKTALENEMIEFVVHFIGQPVPKICWFKDGFEIFSSRRTRILTETDKSVLTIHQVALSDEGEIKCTATNKAGHCSTKATMKVEAPPVIRLPRQYEDGLLFELDEIIRLKVSIAGRPQPLVFWTHNGESIQNDERYEVTNTDRSSLLRINQARRSDRGEYQIRAVNTIGEDSTSFLVTVTDKPKPPPALKVIMTLGKTVTLNWSEPEDDGGCKIGNYIVEYYRLGWNVWLKAATSRKLTTTLTDLIEGSEYKFRVKAESPYGLSGPSNETDVIFIPDPKRGLLTPPARSRSQPRENCPVPPKRRSASTTRTPGDLITSSAIPIPPKREKLKSPQKTPEQSPMIQRRMNGNNVNKNLFDRTSLVRELSYGSPDLKPGMKSKPNESPNLNKRDRSPSRINQFLTNILTRRSPSPSPNSNDSVPNTPSPEVEKKDFLNTTSLKGDHLDRLSPKIMNRRLSSPTILTRTENTLSPINFQRSRSPSLFVNTSEKSSDYILDQYSRSPSPDPSTELVKEKPNTLRERSQSPVPVLKQRSPSPTFDLRERSQSPKLNLREGSSSPVGSRRRDSTQPRNNNDLIHGSSEFMLVLLEDQGDVRSNYFLYDNMIPPPMSLSAPELGTDSSLFIPTMKPCASSSELLNERAFTRFANEAEMESNKLRPVRKESLKIVETDERRPSIPKILINSMDDEEIVGLERKSSFTRRLSAGVTNLAQHLWAKRRQSLGNAEETENLRKMKNLIINEKKRENVLNNWNEEEESSEDEEESISSSEESESNSIQTQKEEETYHPKLINQIPPKHTEPFEILNKPSPLPDPNFIPKPILKQNQRKDETLAETIRKHQTTPSPPQTPPGRTILQTQMMSAAEAARNKRLQNQNRYNTQEESRVTADHYANIVRQYGCQRTARDEMKPRVPSPCPKPKTRSRSTSRTREQKSANQILAQNIVILPRTPSPNRVIASSRTPSPRPLTPEQEALQAEAELKMRTNVDYLTDVAMFIVACWLYLFHDARLAIPVLIVMVYRQLQDELRKLLAGWLTKER